MRRFNDRGAIFKVRNSIFFSIFFLVLGSTTFLTTASAAELIENGGFEVPDLLTFDPDSKAAKKGWTSFFGQNYTENCEADTNLAEPTLSEQCNGGMLIPGWSVLWTDTLSDKDDPGTPENEGPQPGRIEIQNNSLPDRRNTKIIDNGGNPIAYAKSGAQKAELDSHDRFLPGSARDDDGNIDRKEDRNPNTNISIFQEFEVCPRAAYQLTYSWRSRTTLPGDNDVRVLANDTVVRINKLNTMWQTEVIHFVTPDHTDSALAFVSIGDGTTKGMSLDAVSLTGPLPGNCPLPPSCPLDDESSDDGSSDDGSSDDGSGDDGSSDDGSGDDGSSDDGSSDSQVTSLGNKADSRFVVLSSSDDGSSDDGSSDDGGNQCANPDDDCGFCRGDGMASLTLLYDGNDFTSYSQTDATVSMVPAELGLQGFPVNALIEVYNDSDTLLFTGEVEIGHLFEIANPSTSLRVDIYDPVTRELAQTVEFHTSCSELLEKFDEFGGITIWSGVGYDN